MLNIKEFDLKISEIIEETHDTKTFRINLEGNEFNFEPSQFINLTIDIEGKPITRQYSIASSPLKKEYIDLTVKKNPNGLMSIHLIDKIKVGDVVNIKGPYGLFIYNDEVKKAVFLAGGSGVSSLMSMIRYIVDKKLNTKITLIFSNRTSKDIIFKDELENLKNNHNLNLINTITREDSWQGEKGRINPEMIKKYCDLDSMFYICGLPKMVDGIRRELESLGVDKSKIKFEKY